MIKYILSIILTITSISIPKNLYIAIIYYISDYIATILETINFNKVFKYRFKYRLNLNKSKIR